MPEATDDTPKHTEGDQASGSKSTCTTPEASRGPRPFDFRRLRGCVSAHCLTDGDRAAGSLTTAAQLGAPPTTY